MFTGEKYLTAGVERTVPFVLQMFLWECITNITVEKDYLQIFCLSSNEKGQQVIEHSQERPEYKEIYILDVPFSAVHAKMYVIDGYFEAEDRHITTMLLAKEY